MTDVLVGGYYPVYVGLPKENHTEHDSITVDQGAVHIDADDPEHVVRIKHDRNDGVDILTAVDNVSGTKSAHIDSAGALHCPNLLYGSDPERNVGTDISIEIRAASGRLKPRPRAAVMVMPEREVPGISATAWARPMTIASRQVQSSASRTSGPKRSAM